MGKYTDDDYCDIYERKICDNCGKCLEAEGVDIKAIKIEDIAKTVEENKLLEDEYKKELENLNKEDEDEVVTESDISTNDLKMAYEELSKQTGIDLNDFKDDKYEDAFDHIEYLDEFDLFDEGTLEDMTEEVFPGVRKLKNQK